MEGRLAGQVTLDNVVRGALRSGYLGYWIDRSVAGRGLGSLAVALVCDHAFGAVGLHRVEADIRPENLPSQRLVERLGFRQEGLLRRYLEIDGDWRDHLAYALLAEDLPAGVLARWRERSDARAASTPSGAGTPQVRRRHAPVVTPHPTTPRRHTARLPGSTSLPAYRGHRK